MITVETNYSHGYSEEEEKLRLSKGTLTKIITANDDASMSEELDTWLKASKITWKPREKIKYLENYESAINRLWNDSEEGLI